MVHELSHTTHTRAGRSRAGPEHSAPDPFAMSKKRCTSSCSLYAAHLHTLYTCRCPSPLRTRRAQCTPARPPGTGAPPKLEIATTVPRQPSCCCLRDHPPHAAQTTFARGASSASALHLYATRACTNTATHDHTHTPSKCVNHNAFHCPPQRGTNCALQRLARQPESRASHLSGPTAHLIEIR